MRPVVFFVIVSLALSIATAVYAEHGAPAPFITSLSGDAATGAASAPTTTMPGLPATTTTTLGTSPPTTNPEEIARTEAMGVIPDEILAPLGGRDALKVLAFDTIDDGLEGWTGGVVTFEDGHAVMGKGFAQWSQPLTPPFAVVGRVSFSADAFFEIIVEDGVWATPSLRRWGFYGHDDEFTPNIYVGNSEAAPTGAGPIAAEPGEWYWIILAINEDAALYGFWLDGTEAASVGVTGPIDWDVAEYSLGIQVFPDGGLLTVDEYYLLAP